MLTTRRVLAMLAVGVGLALAVGPGRAVAAPGGALAVAKGAVAVMATAAATPMPAYEMLDARTESLVAGLHGVPAATLKRLSLDTLAQLRQVAADPKRPLYHRVRALGLVGAKPSTDNDTLWAAARQWPQRELRIQAALSQAMAARRVSLVHGRTVAAGLLQDAEPEIREVGINQLALLHGVAGCALVREHAQAENDPVLRQLLQRRLAKGAACGGDRTEASR